MLDCEVTGVGRPCGAPPTCDSSVFRSVRSDFVDLVTGVTPINRVGDRGAVGRRNRVPVRAAAKKVLRGPAFDIEHSERSSACCLSHDCESMTVRGPRWLEP